MSAIDKVQTNLKDRFNTIKRVPSGVKNTLNTAKSEFTVTKPPAPVQAGLVLVKGAVDGIINFIEDQCEITRRWL